MKSYPPRKKITKKSMCDCGHEHLLHESELKQVIWFYLRRWDYHAGKCIVCTCPKFQFEKWEFEEG